MHLFPPTIIIRHRKENLKKCSLRGLEKREDMTFFSYPLKKELPALTNYVLLNFDGPELSLKDFNSGIILIDGTWKYAAKMQSQVKQLDNIQKRSLPKCLTGYPRKQTLCPFPDLGLASIEALFVAYRILKRDSEDLLENYAFKKAFFEKNLFN